MVAMPWILTLTMGLFLQQTADAAETARAGQMLTASGNQASSVPVAGSKTLAKSGNSQAANHAAAKQTATATTAGQSSAAAGQPSLAAGKSGAAAGQPFSATGKSSATASQPAAAATSKQASTATNKAAMTPVTASKDDAKRVLKTAESIRSLDQAQMDVSLDNINKKTKTVYELDILRSTGNRALVSFTAPTEEVGRKMLANKSKYWSSFPDSKKVVAISRKEMIGNSAFALADIFQLDAETDYDPTIVGEETCGKATCQVLILKAKHDEAPYAKIQYWVEKKDSFPVRAQFYGVSGKHLKTMLVEERSRLGGRLRPSRIRMVDEVTKGKLSVWHTHSMEAADLPDSLFTKEALEAK